MRNVVKRVLDILCGPVDCVARRKRSLRIILGVTIMVVASTIAHFAGDPSMRFSTTGSIMLDSIAWTLHGLGAAPILRVLIDFLKFE